jgi:prephenate dehydrogenase
LKSDFKIGIIGGNGEMGKSFKNFFNRNGINVLISDIGTKYSNIDIVQKCNIIILSVPLNKYEEILIEIAEYLKNDEHLIMDIGSLKLNPLITIKKYFSGEILATHPLFGPDKKFQAGENIVA